MLDGILGGQHPESLRQGDRLVPDGDLTFLHGLEQCALDLGRRAVDFIGQEDAGHDRSGAYVERTGRGAVDLGPGQIGGEQVRGELNPAEGEVERLGQGTNGSRLGEAGNPLDQDVTSGEQGDDQPLQQRTLPDDLAFDPIDEAKQTLLGRGDRGGRTGRIVDGHQAGRSPSSSRRGRCGTPESDPGLGSERWCGPPRSYRRRLGRVRLGAIRSESIPSNFGWNGCGVGFTRFSPRGGVPSAVEGYRRPRRWCL